MQASEIIVPKKEALPAEPDLRPKLRQAYISERQSLELLEIELNRSKVVMIDENGRIVRFSLTSEH
ncbi:hypothetical protein FNO25_000390 [Vibrio fluvialis]|uniref:hypothetical protein n=1 Tax=Vibrio fluvialis TaxID=676 RepID=UPI0013029E48|nr:hypothetical protein [Vibrio fluvialis]EKO3444229.1 hypothetical protein [Vibrio fluvialis]EKO3466421.1 hypothetical protein [Vibrio fluvialis]EKO3504763.1 hypothetical protein [Vibrio fluvialis]EKO3519536.1 hypothetical protein [Vibrio fluvialis]EKO3949534.1 hypothetical protein [Vibrio fluvialis]